MPRNYKKAFKCAECPGSHDEDGCPMWWEYVQEHIETKEVKVIKGCGFQEMQVHLTHAMAAANRPAAAFEGLRNEIAKSFAILPALILENNKRKELENGSGRD